MHGDLHDGLYTLRRFAETLKEWADEAGHLTTAMHLAEIHTICTDAIQQHERTQTSETVGGNGAAARVGGIPAKPVPERPGAAVRARPGDD